MKITSKVAMKLGNKFGINFTIVPFDEWKTGLNIELEHGSKLSKITNVTNDSITKSAQIAIAHLIEDPRYYYHLKKLEDKRETYWKNKKKPSIFL
jgi:hypothetical protein